MKSVAIAHPGAGSRPAALGVRAPATVPVAVLGATCALAAMVGIAIGVDPLLAFAAVAAVALVVAMLVWPAAATVLVVFLVFANLPAVAVAHGAPNMLVGLYPLLLAVPLTALLVRGEQLVAVRGLMAVALFLVVMLVSTGLSSEPQVAAARVLSFLVEGLLVFFLITNVVRTPEILRRVMWTILVAASALATITLLQKLTGTFARPYGGFGLIEGSYFVGKSDVARAAGPIGDPNYYAQGLLVAVPLGLVCAWRERPALLRCAAAGMTALICLAIMLTYSRGAGLAFVVVLALMGIMRSFRPSHLVALLVGAGLLFAVVPEYPARIAQLSGLSGATAAAGADNAADESTRSRTTEMMAAALVTADHPIFGVGPSVFPLFYQEYARRVGIEVRESVHLGKDRGAVAQRQAHNIFLGISADLGIPGLAVFCGLLWVIIQQLVRGRRRCLRSHPQLAALATGFMLAVVAYVLTGLFLTLAFERYFWLLIALAASAGSIACQQRAPWAADAEPTQARA